MPFLRIVFLCVGLAVGYGIVHDLVTVHVCVEYFTIGHPRVIASTAPVALALTWGVLATWWVGLGLGVVLGLACRVGRRPRLTWRDVLRPGLVLLAVMGAAAVLAGSVGRSLASGGSVVLVGGLATRVPPDRHVDFLTCLWAHNASYLIGGVGGIVLATGLWRQRGRLVRAAAPGALVVAVLLLAGCMESKATIRLEADGSGRFVQRVSIDASSRDALLRRLARLHGAETDPETLPFADPFAPAWIRARAERGEGYDVEKVERTVAEDGTLTTEVVARFAQLADAARGGAFYPARVSLDRVAKRRWKLEIADAWARPLQDEDGRLAGRPAKAFVEAVADLLKGYRVERRIFLPGRIVETNGETGDDGRSVTFVVDHAKIVAAKDLVLEVEFEADEDASFLGVRHQSDPEELMVRALEAPPGVPARR